MDRPLRSLIVLLAVASLAAGCRSPYHSDRGALVGGLLGAGTGAIIGDAVGGDAAAGAAIGAGIGALGGAAVGAEMDEVEARNRAMIEAQMGRQVAAGSVTLDDVVAMTRAGVDEELIVTHIRANGCARRLDTNDLIFLQQQAVSTRVIKAMQEPPPAPRSQAPVVVERTAPAPIIVEEHHYGPPVWCGPPVYRHHHRPHPRPGISWGISFHD